MPLTIMCTFLAAVCIKKIKKFYSMTFMYDYVLKLADVQCTTPLIVRCSMILVLFDKGSGQYCVEYI